MSPSATALVGFAAWTLTLVLVIGLMRCFAVLAGKRAPNQFDPGGADLSDFSRRVCRAHANCYENLPIFGALITVALVTGCGSCKPAGSNRPAIRPSTSDSDSTWPSGS